MYSHLTNGELARLLYAQPDNKEAMSEAVQRFVNRNFNGH